MLFTFPVSPPASNWLQDFVIVLVKEVLDAKVSGRVALGWKRIMPALLAPTLARRTGLKARYIALEEASHCLSNNQARLALVYLNNPFYYSDVLSGVAQYTPVGILPDNFKEALKSLFEFSFELLGKLPHSSTSNLSIRDALYLRAYESMPGHFCPFCGIDRFDAPHPDMPRHALDHYLAISSYCLFGAHLPNLVPMCTRCNSSFKLAIDMLVDANGAIRPCLDPHGNQTVSVSLAASSPFGGGTNGEIPMWDIDFIPAIPAVETWAQVFEIRLRYKESILDADYKAWLGDFANWAVDGLVAVNDNQQVGHALERWANLCPRLGDQGFIKRPMFQMLAASARACDNAGNRVTRLVKTLCMA